MGRNSNYEKSVYNQLQEVMTRLNTFEKDSKVEHTKLNKKIDILTEENTKLKTENQLLKNDNERLKRIINNNSSNSSLPPSSDQKSKGSNQYNGRTKSEKQPGAQKGHHIYCAIMSVVETCKRKNMHVFQNITKIFEGTPAIF